MNVKKDGLAQSGNEQSRLVFIEQGKPMTTSRLIAKIFEKEHRDVTRGIDSLFEKVMESKDVKDVRNFTHIFSENDPHIFLLSNFFRVTSKDSYGREQPEYHMTKDGFALVVMGYTGAKAIAFKIGYIERFNEMETRLRQREEKQLLTMKDFVRIGGSGFEDVMKPIPTYLDECDRNVRPYMMTLEKMGYSLRSGSIWRRQNRYPLQFTTVDGILCITEAYAEKLYLNKVNAHNDRVLSQVQLAFNFKKEGGSHDNN